MKQPRWTAEELQQLELMAGNYPVDRFNFYFNQWATANGYTERSAYALRIKISQLNLKLAPIGDWITSGYAASVLGVCCQRTRGWCDRGLISCYCDGRKRRHFKRADLRRLAQKHPSTFAGITANKLYQLLEDYELAESIATMHPIRSMDPRPVRAVENGWQYPSISAAARRVHVTHRAIQYALTTGGTSAGYHWEYAS